MLAWIIWWFYLLSKAKVSISYPQSYPVRPKAPCTATGKRLPASTRYHTCTPLVAPTSTKSTHVKPNALVHAPCARPLAGPATARCRATPLRVIRTYCMLALPYPRVCSAPSRAGPAAAARQCARVDVSPQIYSECPVVQTTTTVNKSTTNINETVLTSALPPCALPCVLPSTGPAAAARQRTGVHVLAVLRCGDVPAGGAEVLQAHEVPPLAAHLLHAVQVG